MPVVCVFEDDRWADLLPLVYCRPAYELRCGISSLLDKTARAYPGQKLALLCRDYLADTLRERTTLPVNNLPADQDVLFLNGRLLLGDAIPLDGPEELGMCDGSLAYARLRAKTAAAIASKHFLGATLAKALPHTMRHVDVKATLLRYYWEIIHHNEEELRRDFKALATPGEIRGKVHEGSHILGRENVFIGEGAVVKPCCVIDAEDGPVYLAEGVKVMPNSCIQGPAYVGPNSTIQMAARLREGTNIGEVCKVGGEIENSILHSYSNKQHDGFLGHAYVGQWVNLAADTINSDLKNTYGTVRVQLPHKLVETGSMFVGLAVGDHSKSAIASTFLTGSVVGYCCNVLTSRFPPKLVPSFSWLSDSGCSPYSPTLAVEVARRVLSRRRKQVTDADAALIHKLYDLTQSERDTLGMEQ
ncbi:MAG TPA: putative sugar nucleotidyl transferase [Planctomycetota bacterium]|nr:putative sugar nucleotidyl transferase [Planctomycetota bacterium]